MSAGPGFRERQPSLSHRMRQWLRTGVMRGWVPAGRGSCTGATNTELIVVSGLLVATIIAVMGVFRNDLTTAVTNLGCKISAAARGEEGGCGSGSATAGGTAQSPGTTNIRQGGLAGGLVVVPDGAPTPTGAPGPAGSPGGGSGAGGGLAGSLTGLPAGSLAGNVGGGPNLIGLAGAGYAGGRGNAAGSGGPAGLPGESAVGGAPGGRGASLADTTYFTNNPGEIPKYDVRPIRGVPFIKDKFPAPDDPAKDQDIRANDVAQGNLGDCYVLSALATIAETNPDLIRNAIVDKGGGNYEVTLYDNAGNPVTILVDSRFPVKKSNGSHPFAKPGDTDGNDQELWVLLIEKAYAQSKLTYGNMEGGFGNNALQTLTGQPSRNYGLTATQHYASNPPTDGVLTPAILQNAIKNGHAITIGSLPTSGAAGNPLYGGTNPIASGHEYYITGYDPETRTYTVHNPWGWRKNVLHLTYDELKNGFSDVSINSMGKR